MVEICREGPTAVPLYPSASSSGYQSLYMWRRQRLSMSLGMSRSLGDAASSANRSAHQSSRSLEASRSPTPRPPLRTLHLADLSCVSQSHYLPPYTPTPPHTPTRHPCNTHSHTPPPHPIPYPIQLHTIQFSTHTLAPSHTPHSTPLQKRLPISPIPTFPCHNPTTTD